MQFWESLQLYFSYKFTDLESQIFIIYSRNIVEKGEEGIVGFDFNRALGDSYVNY